MSDPVIDCDFPGGNILIEDIQGDTVRLRQDLRDTEGEWFYWCFRLRGAGGRRLRFVFTGSRAIGVRGPAGWFGAAGACRPGGEGWSWLGADCVDGNSFSCTIPTGADEARFGFTVPYTRADLDAFLAGPGKGLHVRTLCRSRGGRDVPLLHAGRTDDGALRVLLTCRHHCCEAMASFALEGLLTAVLPRGDANGLGETVQLICAPLMDADGVERGDQGKNRKPRDHNRDYAGESLYPETAAVREMVNGWGGRPFVSLDLHCPHISGKRNQDIYFVGNQREDVWGEVGRLSELLERMREGPLPYRAESNLPFGVDWNQPRNYDRGRGCSSYMAEQPGVRLASGMEIPYADAGGVEVTPHTARRFGRDLARALVEYLRAAPNTP